MASTNSAGDVPERIFSAITGKRPRLHAVTEGCLVPEHGVLD
jgi:hypothetical protein